MPELPAVPLVPEVDMAEDKAYEAVIAYDDVMAGGSVELPVKLPFESVKITRLLPLIYTSCQYVPSAERCVL